MPTYLEENDISVTKFLDRVVDEFLTKNDISVTKFLQGDNDISVTKFLNSDPASLNSTLDNRGKPRRTDKNAKSATPQP